MAGLHFFYCLGMGVVVFIAVYLLPYGLEVTVLFLGGQFSLGVGDQFEGVEGRPAETHSLRLMHIHFHIKYIRTII